MAESQATEIYLIMAVGTAAMLSMAIAIILFVVFYQKRMIRQQTIRQSLELEYQQKMLLAALESQENERKRLAADLHDGIGSMLSTIRVSLSAFERPESVTPQHLSQTKQMIDDTIMAVRTISRDLLPATLETFGLSYAVKEMIEQYALVSGETVLFEETGQPVKLEKTTEVMVFRIIQEAVTNALKHAQAGEIHVTLDWNETLTVVITDNGTGFSETTLKSGLGLFNMQNRARLIGSVLTFGSIVNGGTTITLKVSLS